MNPISGTNSRDLCEVTAAACVVASPAIAASHDNRNARVVREFIETVFIGRNIAAADSYVAPDYVQHNCKVAPGLAGFKQSMASWFASVPPMREQILHLVTEGEFVVTHNRLTFTKGDRSQTVEGFDLYRLKGGKIVEHWDSDSTADCSVSTSSWCRQDATR